jgi:hypothetical protein
MRGWGKTEGRSQYQSIKRAKIIGLANMLPILDPTMFDVCGEME